MSYEPNLLERGLVFIDTETTGLSPKHEIIEIGGLLVKADFSVEEEFEFKIKPERIEDAEPEALRVNRYNPEEWKSALSLKEVLSSQWTKWENRLFCGWYTVFDYSFLANAFFSCGLPVPFYRKAIDVFSLAYLKLRADPSMRRFTLKEVCALLDIAMEDQHRALSDARSSYEIFVKLVAGKDEQKTLF